MTASAVELLARMYGADLADGRCGRDRVVHVAAVWRAGSDALTTLRIGDETPKSDYDTFALSVARARADAIVTTGQILRDEPGVTHEPFGRWAAELVSWRADVLGLSAPPAVLVLTSGRGIPPDRSLEAWHPALATAARAIVYTSRDAASRLGSAVGDGVHVHGAARPSLRGAVSALREMYGHRTISIEAGASTTGALYDDPVAVDELMLSAYACDRIPDTVRGPAFVTPSRIARVLPRCRSRYRPPGAPWWISRHARE